MTKREWINRVYKNFREFAPRFLKIRDKSGKIVPFVLNEEQEEVLDIILDLIAQGKPVRIIILKARQVGMSTFIEAFIYFLSVTNFHMRSAVIAHVDRATQNLYEMTNRYYREFPDSLKPTVKNSNELKLHFDKLDSVIKTMTAGSRGKAGHSDTLNNLHISELSRWPAASETLKGLLETVPILANTLVIIESTANGIGEEFYNRWQSAVKGESDYIPVFISWWKHKEYQMSFNNIIERKNFEKNLTDYEKGLMQTYGVTLEQLNWRRYKIRNEFERKELDFNEQYPSTPDEAFLTSGRPVFDLQKVNEKYLEAKKAKYVEGNIEYVYDDKNKITGVKFVPMKGGFVRIYNSLKLNKYERNRFAGGWDIAEGLEQGDYTHGRYLDRKNMEMILSWHGHMDADKVGDEIRKIQILLGGDAWTCVERNNHGLTTLFSAFHKNVRLYMQQAKFDEGIPVDTAKIGFKTSPATKPIIINRLNAAIRDDLWIDNDVRFWGECRTFVRNDSGQMQAQGKDKDNNSKCFDDIVISGALMWECHVRMPPFVKLKEPAKAGGRENAFKSTSNIKGKAKY
jgi:hypothetical protein